MKVIKHGNRIKEKIFTCANCGCEFIPSDSDLAELDGEIFTPCPECLEDVYQPETFVNRETEIEKHIRRREALVSEIAGFVDFDKIHTAMKALDWKWWFCDIPSAEQIKEEVTKHLREAFDKKEDFFSGGICVKYLPKDEYGDEGLDFAFVLENYGAFYNNNEKIVTIP